MEPMPNHRRLGAAALLAGLLAGCAGGPDVTPGAGADLGAARQQLIVSALDGPIPLVIDTVPAPLQGPAAEQDIATLIARTTAWANATFRPEPFDGLPSNRLILWFADQASASPATICTTPPPTGAVALDPPRLHAVFCRGSTPVADTIGVAGAGDRAAAEQLVTRTVARLFPDYSSGSRFPGVSIFGGIGSGGGGSGGGVGIGLGF
jgi:hypothetical protein